MAMPSDRASAPAAVICALPERYPAYTTPTAMPSGMLCSVTASTIIVVQAALRPFGLGAVRVQVRDDVIQREQKQDAEPEAQKGGEERELPHTCRLLDRRDQQAPDRSRHHHTGGETGQRALHGVTERFLHKEHARRAQRGAEKRDQDPPKCLHKTASFLLWIRLFSQVR